MCHAVEDTELNSVPHAGEWNLRHAGGMGESRSLSSKLAVPEEVESCTPLSWIWNPIEKVCPLLDCKPPNGNF